MKFLFRTLLCACLCLPVLTAQAPTPDEIRRMNEIRARFQRGETITPEDKAWAVGVQRRQQQGQKQGQKQGDERFAEYAKTHPPQETTGMVPLSELGKGTYKGEEGGLYPGGTNQPPAAHRAAGLALARKIAPVDGKIVLLSIGMSNTTMEFQTFQKLAAADRDLNPNLLIVDGAQGGRTARFTARPEDVFWKELDRRIAAAGAKNEQVQAVWLKQANGGPTQPFPAEAKQLEADILGTLNNLRARYPNLRIVYFSSRIYAGYAASPLNPEPHAFESAFSVKWLIAGQIAGRPELNCDPAKGPVKMPWLAWGPYLWGDGLKARADGLVWTRADLGKDGTHPDATGREKVAKLLLEFFKSDATSKSWFLKAR
jgi:hypothetical protein